MHGVARELGRGIVIPPQLFGTELNQNTTYDGNGNIISHTNFRRDTDQSYIYDTSRNLETQRQVLTFAQKPSFSDNFLTVNTDWHLTFRLPRHTTEVRPPQPDRVTTYDYDTQGNLSRRNITSGTQTREWNDTYFPTGQIKTVDGPRTDLPSTPDVTTYSYYTDTTTFDPINGGHRVGDLKTVTNALNQITTYASYTADGWPVSTTDPNGAQTQLTYDSRGRIKSRTFASAVTLYDYYNTGLLKKVTAPDATFIIYAYDAAHRLTDITDALGNRVHYTLDNIGRVTKVENFSTSNTLTKTISYGFDDLNRLTSIVDGQNQTTSISNAYSNISATVFGPRPN